LALDKGTLATALTRFSTQRQAIIPPPRTRYLAEIAETVRGYHDRALSQSRIARERQQLRAAKAMLAASLTPGPSPASGRGELTPSVSPAGGGEGQGEGALDKLIAERDAA